MNRFQEKERELEERYHHSSALKCFKLGETHVISAHSPLVRISYITSSYARRQGNVGEHRNFSGQQMCQPWDNCNDEIIDDDVDDDVSDI